MKYFTKCLVLPSLITNKWLRLGVLLVGCGDCSTWHDMTKHELFWLYLSWLNLSWPIMTCPELTLCDLYISMYEVVLVMLTWPDLHSSSRYLPDTSPTSSRHPPDTIKTPSRQPVHAYMNQFRHLLDLLLEKYVLWLGAWFHIYIATLWLYFASWYCKIFNFAENLRWTHMW